MLLEGIRILLAEDDPDLREIMTESLEGMGAVITAVGTGRDGIAAFESLPNSFDAIVSDIRMPNGDGLEFSRAVKAIQSLATQDESSRQCCSSSQKFTIFIVYSGHTEVSDAELHEAGVDAFFSKPVAMVDIALQIKAFVELTRSQASA